MAFTLVILRSETGNPLLVVKNSQRMKHLQSLTLTLNRSLLKFSSHCARQKINAQFGLLHTTAEWKRSESPDRTDPVLPLLTIFGIPLLFLRVPSTA